MQSNKQHLFACNTNISQILACTATIKSNWQSHTSHPKLWRNSNTHFFSINGHQNTLYIVHLKGNITFVYAHTANAAWFFSAIIVVTSNVMQKCQRRISRLFVSGIYALNTLYGTCVTWEFWFTNEISKRRWEKGITNRAEWTSSSVLHCNVTVAAWRREITRDVAAAL